MRIEAILFDKDGTLFDFQATWADPVQKFLDLIAPGDAMPKAAEAMGFDLASGTFHADSVAIAGSTDDLVRVVEPFTAYSAPDILRMLDEAADAARPMPAVPLRPCLTALKSRYVLGVVTNDSEAPARAHLRHESIEDLFDFIAGYDSGFGAKPGPGQLLAFADQFRIAPEATLMVGDSRHDLAAGRAAGVVTIGVLTGIAVADDLADLADVILPDISHLDDWLDKNDTNRR